MRYKEVQFDGLVGPTHNYAGLSYGNTASVRHQGMASNPREAVLQGIEKMKFVSGLGIPQAFLLPHERPHLRSLRNLGFAGTDEQILVKAIQSAEHLFRLVSSASSMWTANAATVVSSEDSLDRKLHIVPANLSEMFHRSIEASFTTRQFRALFANSELFSVHDPLPAGLHFADEGAANHTRLQSSQSFLHIWAWGRSAFQSELTKPRVFPARQTKEASEALCRFHQLASDRIILVKQNPMGIDEGAFHTDVLAVGNDSFLMAHEWAFENQKSFVGEIQKKLQGEVFYIEATQEELPIEDAVKAYPFNSQVLTLPSGDMTIIAPVDSQENIAAYRFLERVKNSGGPVKSVHYLDIRQSMQNGGGPACLRLRVRMNENEISKLSGRVLFNNELYEDLKKWAAQSYRDRLVGDDLRDPQFWRETMKALDELTKIVKLPSLYDFQV